MRHLWSLFVVTAIVTLPTSVPAKCAAEVARFLASPSRDSFAQIANLDRPVTRGDCGARLLVPTVDRELLRTVEAGDPWSIRFLAQGLTLLDGGELEDALRAIGVSVDRNATVVLRLYADKAISADAFTSVLTMLPLDFVDNKQGTEAELAKRANALEGVSDRALATARDLGLKALRRRVDEVRRWPE